MNSNPTDKTAQLEYGFTSVAYNSHFYAVYGKESFTCEGPITITRMELNVSIPGEDDFIWEDSDIDYRVENGTLLNIVTYKEPERILLEDPFYDAVAVWTSAAPLKMEFFNMGGGVKMKGENIGSDETPLQVRYGKRYGDGWMWVGLSGNGRTAVFLFDKHRSGKAAMRLLEGSCPGDYLMVDDCPSYHKTIKQLRLVDMRCMVHIRRKFVDARKAGSKEKYVNRMLIKIGQLYRIERFATKIGADSKKRGELCKKYSSQIMTKIKALLDNPGFSYLPQSTIGKAIDHFKKNWEQADPFYIRKDEMAGHFTLIH